MQILLDIGPIIKYNYNMNLSLVTYQYTITEDQFNKACATQDDYTRFTNYMNKVKGVTHTTINKHMGCYIWVSVFDPTDSLDNIQQKINDAVDKYFA
jgi:hypothetical protein